MATAEFSLKSPMMARLETWEDNVNVSNNTSVVHARIKVWRSNSYTGPTWSSSVTKRIIINGIVVYDQVSEITHYLSYGEITVAEGSTTVTHNSDGTKTVNVSCSLTDNAGGYYTGSGALDMGLSTIPRAATINSFTGNDVDGTFKVSYTAKSSSFTHKLRISIPQVKALQTNNYSSGASFSLSSSTIQALYEYTANSPTVKLGAVIETWNGSTKIGESSELVNTCNITNANPAFSNYTYADTNSTTKAITGNDQYIVQGMSTLVATISATNKATAKKQATMKSYAATINGVTTTASYSSSDAVTVNIGTVDATSDSILSMAAIDSRGYRTTVNKTANIVPYSAPAVIARGTRANNFEKETTIHIEGSVSLLQVAGATKNAVNATSGVQYRYRENGTSTWGSWTNVASTMGSNGVIGTTDFVLSLDNMKAYDFEARITDKLKTTTVDFTVSIGIPIFRVGTRDNLCYNNEEPLMVSHVGQIIMSTTLDTAAKVKALYGGTWVAWGQGKVPVGVNTSDSDFSTVNATGGVKTVTLNIDQIPPHRHEQYVSANEGSNAARRDWSSDGNASVYPQGCNTGSTGGGQAHNNIQPYQVCYFWRRTV